MLRVGLTGGVASGKSTVAAMLSELGAYVVDADRLAHEITAPGGAAYEALRSRFGEGVIDAAGRVDRVALGRVVFADASARRDLERIVHPALRAEAARRFERAAREEGRRIGIFDAALLVETGAYRDLHRLIVVRCARETQLQRLRERNGLSAEEAEARIAAQAPLEDKLAVADYVIDTDGTLEHTRRQTSRVFAGLGRDFEREFPGSRRG